MILLSAFLAASLHADLKVTAVGNLISVAVDGKVVRTLESVYDPVRMVRVANGSYVVATTKGILHISANGYENVVVADTDDGDPRALISQGKWVVFDTGNVRLSRFEPAPEGADAYRSMRQSRTVWLYDATAQKLRKIGQAPDVGLPLAIAAKGLFTLRIPNLKSWFGNPKIRPQIVISRVNLASFKVTESRPLRISDARAQDLAIRCWVQNGKVETSSLNWTAKGVKVANLWGTTYSSD